MPIIGMSFSSMEAKRTESPVTGEIQVNSAPKINEVKEISLANFGQKALSMAFEFVTTYSQNVGEIKLEGNLLFLSENNSAVLKAWKKEKALPEEVSVPVLNHLFRRCLVKIAGFAEDLQLPPPLQLPLVKGVEKAGS